MKKLTQQEMVGILKNRTPGYDLDEIARKAGWEDFFDYTEDESLEEFGPDEMKSTDPNWGGRRDGAGRPVGTTKPEKKAAWSTRLRADQIEWLKSQPEPAAKIIERLIDIAMKKSGL